MWRDKEPPLSGEREREREEGWDGLRRLKVALREHKVIRPPLYVT